MLNALGETLRWFAMLTGELVALFLGVSLLVSILQALISEEQIRSLMGRPRSIAGYLVGAALGAVTPFCSCSTIPIVAGLLRSGAPFGPTMAFLISSPLLNPVIIALLLPLMGVRNTILYAVVAFVGSMAIGASWSRLGLHEDVKNVVVRRPHRTDGDDPPRGSVLGEAWSSSWGLFVSMLPYLLVGTAVGAFIYGVVPAEWVLKVAGPGNRFAIPIAAVIGVPMYVRTETLIPISRALLDKGMGLGAVVALIIGGAGASIPEVSMLKGLFKTRLVICFVVSILVFSMVSGLVFQYVG